MFRAEGGAARRSAPLGNICYTMTRRILRQITEARPGLTQFELWIHREEPNKRGAGGLMLIRGICTLATALSAIQILAACEVLTPIEEYNYDALVFDATAEIERDTIWYSLIVQNTSDEVVEFSSTCAEDKSAAMVAMRIYDPTIDGGRLRWDSSIPPHPEAICTQEITRGSIRAGAVKSISNSQPISEILGDSIRPGSYRLSVMPNFDGLYREREVAIGIFALEP